LESLQNKIKPSEYFLKQGFREDILKKYYVGDCDNSYKPMYLRSYALILDYDEKNAIGVTGRIRYDQCKLCFGFHKQGSGCPSDNPYVKNHPKWLHYGFNVGSVLYNSWNIRKYIKNYNNSIIVTEGPKDVWWLEQHDIKNSTCIFGLNILDYHLCTMIKMGVRKIVVGLDNDEKGIDAMEKLEAKFSDYFKIINIREFMKPGQDIADIDSNILNKDFKSFLNSI